MSETPPTYGAHPPAVDPAPGWALQSQLICCRECKSTALRVAKIPGGLQWTCTVCSYTWMTQSRAKVRQRRDAR
jgi:ribosomal protein L37AE/L43A